MRDGGEVVVRQHDGARLLGRLGPLHAHGHADVGLLQRRRIVDAIAGHGDHLAIGLQRTYQTQLVFRAGTGEHPCLGDGLAHGRIVHQLQLRAGDRLDVLAHAQLPGDGAGGHTVVTGDHHHTNAGRAALGHRPDRLVTGWIDDAHQAEQGQPAGDIGMLEVLLARAQPTPGEGQYPTPGARLRLDLVVPVRLIQRALDAVGLQLLRAHGQNAFRRTLDQYLAAGLAGMQRRHEPMLGFERNHVQPRPVDLHYRRRKPGLHRQSQQRALGGIASQHPVLFLFVQAGVIAQRGGFDQRGRRRRAGSQCCRIDRRTLQQQAAGRRVPGPLDVQ